MATAENATSRYVATMNRRLEPEEVAAWLCWLWGWIAVRSGLAIAGNYRFGDTAKPLLFSNFFSAVARASPFDIVFVLDLEGWDVGVGLSAGSFDGIILACFELAREADRLARRNYGWV